MKLKWGSFLVEGRGKIAGHVASRNTYGSYLRQKVTPVNPSTVAQFASRNKFTAASQAWKALTDAQRKLWRGVAINFTRTNIFGDAANLTGFNLFTRLNKNLLEIGESLITGAPQPKSVTAITALSFDADLNGNVLDVTFSPAIPAGQKVIWYATTGLSAGKNFVKSEYRKISVKDDSFVSGGSLASDYFAVFGVIPEEGSKVFLKCKPLETVSGQPGAELTASTIVVDTTP